jgi:hypothetical protein
VGLKAQREVSMDEQSEAVDEVDASKTIEATGVVETNDEVDKKKPKLVDLNEGKHVSKGKYDALVKEKESLSKQKSELEDKINELSTSVASADELKKQIKELQKQMEVNETKGLNNIKRLALEQAGARDVELFDRLIDMSRVKVLDDGSIEGLIDQIDGVKSSRPYLFNGEKPFIGATQPPVSKEPPLSKREEVANQIIKGVLG